MFRNAISLSSYIKILRPKFKCRQTDTKQILKIEALLIVECLIEHIAFFDAPGILVGQNLEKMLIQSFVLVSNLLIILNKS